MAQDECLKPSLLPGLALSAAATYAPKNIRVNCVAPGLTKVSSAEGLNQLKPCMHVYVIA